MRSILLMFLFITVFCSCSHKDTVCPGGEMKQITVWFDWSKSPSASPEGMTLFFYPISQGGKIWRYDIAGAEGGSIVLPTGSYRMVAFNNDLPAIRLEGIESINTISALSDNITTDGDFVSTGMLYGANVNELDVTPCGVEYRGVDGAMKECGRSIVKCFPDSLATEYIVAVNRVNGADRLRFASVRLNGVSPGGLIYSGNAVDRIGALSFWLDWTQQNSGLKGRGCAFRPVNESQITLDLVITCNDGRSYAHIFDETQLFVNSIGAHRVLIIVDSIDVPDSGSPGENVGGIEADVDGWNAIEVDMNISIPLSAVF